MRPRSTPVVVLAFASVLTLHVPLASAHDDGVTCHAHPTYSTWPVGYSDNLLTASEATVSFPLAVHALENHVDQALEQKRPGFDRSQFLAARKGLTELQEMLQIVGLLVARAERAGTVDEQTSALTVARNTFNELPIRSYFPFDIFLAANRVGGSVVLPIDRVVAFLQSEHGMPDSLAVLFQDAANSC